MLAFLLFLGIFVYAFRTEMAMQAVEDEAPFSETLRAAKDTLPQQRSITLDEPHRTARELSLWVSERVSEALTFDATNYDRQLQAAQSYFSPGGYEEFKTYLAQSNLRNTLQAGDQKVNVIVEQPPLLLNSGAVEGVFRWLYEVPVTISFTPRALKEFSPSATGAEGRKLTVRLQLGRHDDAAVGEGVRIESWAVSARRN